MHRFTPHGLVGSVLFGLAFSLTAQAQLPSIASTQEIEPLEAEITPEPGVGYFGSDVAIFGNVALAGIPGANEFQGRVGIFLRNAQGKWNRKGTLKASDRKAYQYFGEHVAMASGRRALIASSTAVYVFELQSGAWKQTQKLTFSGATEISDLDWQGNLAVVGVLSSSTSNAAYVFDTSKTTLRRVARLVAHDSRKSDSFGSRVAVHGQDVIVTSPGYAQGEGAAYAFSCTTSSCSERQKLIAIEGAPGATFGSAVDIQQNTLVIGAANANDHYGTMDEPPSARNYTAGGAAYVFVRSGANWVESQQLRPSPTQHNWYLALGSSVAIDGNRVLVGAPYGMDRYDGAQVFVYERQNTSLPFTARSVLSSVWSSHGYAVGLYGDTAIVGIPDVAPWWGSAALYDLR